MSIGAFWAQQQLCERLRSFVLTGSGVPTLGTDTLVLVSWISSNIRLKILEQKDPLAMSVFVYCLN